MQTWRLLHDGAASAAWNMALDEALLEAVADGVSLPVLRLYRWTPAAVTLGCFQKGSNVVNLDACRTFGYDVVRRCTGGRAVLHDQEVTYAVMASEDTVPFPGTIAGNYRVIAAVLDTALADLGLVDMNSEPLVAQPRRTAVEESACFTAPSAFEQVVKCCKITGSAQRRRGGAFLQHGSIPVEMDVERLFCVLDCASGLAPDAGGRLLAGRVGWLNRFLPAPVTIPQVERAVIAAFTRQLALNLEPSSPTPQEVARANTLVREKYAQPAWNFSGLAGKEKGVS